MAYAVGGAIAAALLGEPGSTQNVDILAALTPRNIAPVTSALEQAGYYVPHELAKRAVERATSFNVVHRGSAIKADLFIAGRTPLDEDELGRRRLVDVDAERGSIYVAKAEELIAQKLRWYADGEP